MTHRALAVGAVLCLVGLAVLVAPKGCRPDRPLFHNRYQRGEHPIPVWQWAPYPDFDQYRTICAIDYELNLLVLVPTADDTPIATPAKAVFRTKSGQQIEVKPERDLAAIFWTDGTCERHRLAPSEAIRLRAVLYYGSNDFVSDFRSYFQTRAASRSASRPSTAPDGR